MIGPPLGTPLLTMMHTAGGHSTGLDRTWGTPKQKQVVVREPVQAVVNDSIHTRIRSSTRRANQLLYYSQAFYITIKHA